MFGEEYGSPMGTSVCTRCGSKARLRGLQRTNTPIIVCHTCCSKCHFIEFTGFTSTMEVAHKAVKNKLEDLQAKAKHPAIKERLARSLERLERNKRFDDLNL